MLRVSALDAGRLDEELTAMLSTQFGSVFSLFQPVAPPATCLLPLSIPSNPPCVVAASIHRDWGVGITPHSYPLAAPHVQAVSKDVTFDRVCLGCPKEAGPT